MHTKLHRLLNKYKQKDLGDKQAYSRKYRENKRVKQGIRAEWHLASEHVESSLSSAAAAAAVCQLQA